ncbi:phage virion morphogenesis protein [Asaia sp. HN010]|uniref:phage virion morphogenesis protein n=1 Tax=Asaia sp. HN010 TaxID=3081233 RepID=UPI0030185ADC
MASIVITGSFKPMREALTRIAAIGRDPQPVLAAAAVALEDNVRNRIETGTDPKGVKWSDYAPLNPLYAQDKTGPGILRESGELQRTIESSVSGRTIIIGSPLLYSTIHQFGGVIRAKNASALFFVMGGHGFKRKSVTIPARPYLGFSTQDREVLVTHLSEFFRKAVAG